MEWVEVSIKTTTEAVEAVSNILYDAGVAGVVIEDPNDLNFLEKDENSWDYVDESIFQNLYEGAIVKGYLPESPVLIDKIEEIRQLVALLPEYGLDIGIGEVTTLEVHEEDWSHSWKKYYKTTKLGKNIVIKPTWEIYEQKQGELVIEMDPGMAFGTGTHETTMMCVMELENYVKENTTVFDIGCGSGILAITAAKLGAEKVIAVDIDEVAVDATANNVKLNAVENIVSIRRGNLMEVVTEKADVVVANIIAEIIMILSKDIKSFLTEDGTFIASGIILDKVDAVKENLISVGLDVLKVETMGEWAAIVSKVKGGKHE
ncbi:50S ribosomal protein L11 methyltransferase [Clostridium formicaceticum]|uniref:Ribosomal protein L11 methyltransferase n=1 Tax=Clostridium formicaceticum TaxID=1497 RepID=A0AAC9RJB9_9CLOT|nr:50S ribosomal protein L11 methyltransferase [Clostridium formicaceticum]AOY77566.1 ribosomal protein L11 methyltransferase [Clostridium formicaceticum]ARE88144.1 Ribosomal protein L11 methyltransferase [Clostridium formicaceticum]